MEDKDTELLARVTANHLFLGQFEPFRATLLSLRARNPDLARAILQTVVAHGGRFDKVLWSPSCPSPSLLTYLSTIELLQFNDASSIWSFDPDALRLRAEFLLYVQTISSAVSESLRKVIDLEGIEKDADKLESEDSRAELLVGNEELKELNGDSGESLRVLDKLSGLGLNRLKPDLVVADERDSGGTSVVLEEEELRCLRRVILENAEVFDVLCGNIQKQVQGVEHDDSGLALTLRREGIRSEEVDETLLKLIQRSVQIAHLDAMKECFNDCDEEGVLSHIRFLHLDYGVEETEYRYPYPLFIVLIN